MGEIKISSVIAKRLKQTTNKGRQDLCSVIEQLRINKIQSADRTQELVIDMDTRELYFVCEGRECKVIGCQKLLGVRNLGFLSYIAKDDGGNLAGIFVGKYKQLHDFLSFYESLKRA